MEKLSEPKEQVVTFDYKGKTQRVRFPIDTTPTMMEEAIKSRFPDLNSQYPVNEGPVAETSEMSEDTKKELGLIDTVVNLSTATLKGAGAQMLDMVATSVGQPLIEAGLDIKNMSSGDKSFIDTMTTRATGLEWQNEFLQFTSLLNKRTGGIDLMVSDFGQKTLDFGNRLKAVSNLNLRKDATALEGFAYEVGGAAASVAESIGMMLVTKSPIAVGTAWAHMTRAQSYLRALDAEKTNEESKKISDVVGLFNGIVSGIGISYFSSKLPGSTLEKAATRTVIETIENVTQDMGTEAILKLSGVSKATLKDMAKMFGKSLLISLISSAPASAAFSFLENKQLHSPLKNAGFTNEQIQKVLEKSQEAIEKNHYKKIQDIVGTILENAYNFGDEIRHQVNLANSDKVVGKPNTAPQKEYDKIAELSKKKEDGKPTEDLEDTSAAIDYNSDALKKRRAKELISTESLKYEASNFYKYYVAPLSRTAKNISEQFHFDMIKIGSIIKNKTQDYVKRVTPYVKTMSKMAREGLTDSEKLQEYNSTGYAMSISDLSKYIDVLQKNGLDDDSILEPQLVLKELFDEYKKTGGKMEFIDYQFPRSVKRSRLQEYLVYLDKKYNNTETGIFSRSFYKAVSELIDNGKIDPEFVTPEGRLKNLNELQNPNPLKLGELKAKLQDLQLDVVYWLLNGVDRSGRLNLKMSSPKFHRKVGMISPDEYMYFYDPSEEALVSYIYEMVEMTEARKFFGLSEESGKFLADSIVSKVTDTYLKDISPEKRLDAERDLIMVVRAYFGEKGPGNLLATIRDLNYIYLMGHVAPGLTQLSDGFYAVYDSGGLFNLEAWGLYMNSVMSRIGGKAEVDIEALHLKNSIEEFLNRDGLSPVVNKIFGAILSPLDAFTKGTYADTYLKYLQGKSDAELKSLLKIFGEETDSLIQDIRNKNTSENFNLMLTLKLSERFPITKLEMPAGYVTGGNLRYFYMLKTYALKTIDIFREEVFEKLASNNPKVVGQGLGNLAQLVTLMAMFRVPIEVIKSLVNGKELNWEIVPQASVDAILGIMLMSRYQLWDEGFSAKKGVGSFFASSMKALLRSVIPSFPILEDAFKALKPEFALSGFTSGLKPGRFEEKAIPFFGDVIKLVKAYAFPKEKKGKRKYKHKEW